MMSFVPSLSFENLQDARISAISNIFKAHFYNDVFLRTSKNTSHLGNQHLHVVIGTKMNDLLHEYRASLVNIELGTQEVLIEDDMLRPKRTKRETTEIHMPQQKKYKLRKCNDMSGILGRLKFI